MQRRKWKVTITLLTGLTLVWIPVFDGSMFTVRLQDFLHLRSLTENKVDKEPFIRNYSVRTGSQILWKTLENVCWDSNVNGCWQPTDGFLFYSLIEGHFITIGEKFVFTTKSSRWNWCCVRLYINKTTISCFPGKTVLLKLNSTCFFHFLCSGDIHLTPLWFMILQTRLASHSLVVLETFLTILPLQRLWGLLASGGSGRGSHPWWAPLPYRSRSSWNSRGQTLHRLLQSRNFCQRLHLSTGTDCRCSKMRSRI